MEKIRKNLMLMAFALVSVSMLTLSGCKDEDPTYADPTIAASITAVGAGQATITVAVTAPGGLASVTLGDDEIKSYTSDKTSDIFVYNYTGTDNALVFTVTDAQGRTNEAEASLTPVTVVDANITANATWNKNVRYLLKGNIFVTNGAKLTIEPGTVIFGDKVSKGALIVERGAQLIAAGTEAAPIVFTSSAPAGLRNYGDWGGVVLLGKATNNQSANVNIEGITAGTLGQYGGTTDDDNSGTLTYVRIEFAGIALSTDNELNGLTLGSVGSGTTIHHIQVSYSGDDAVEWFGGKVNVKNLVSYRTWDDDFDTDFGFSGKVQFAAAFRHPDVADKSGSNLFESDNDGNGSSNIPFTEPTFANVSAFGPFAYTKPDKDGKLVNNTVSANYQNGAHIRRHSKLHLLNSVVVGAGTSGNFAVRLTDSKGGADAGASVIGNYFGRAFTTVATAPATGTNDNGFNVDDFGDDNVVELTAVDISSKFAGLSVQGSIDAPKATVVLAAGSSLATGAADLTAKGLEKTEYIGAVGTTAGWLDGAWINFAPQSTSY
ncbi:hypothetical protein [Chryseolinea lacunae]|uniref:Cell shape-determining protein MreB n=1 Tax=Chryseolinea lacunae TaxID=2801331 RepID=A0ABS1KRM9_9BACT|nr:hypothetical protein [Chryseolinea lacunae]MBL0741917.1 hypothetical protein [Chryseolinea lacunae]